VIEDSTAAYAQSVPADAAVVVATISTRIVANSLTWVITDIAFAGSY
jgi:hypothetical protein